MVLRPEFGSTCARLKWAGQQSSSPKFVFRASEGSPVSGGDDQRDQHEAVVKSETAIDARSGKDSSLAKLQGSIAAFPPILFAVTTFSSILSKLGFVFHS